MKKLFLLSAFVLLNCMLFSCTADDETNSKSAEVKKIDLNNDIQATYEEGPGDDPMPVQPPKK